MKAQDQGSINRVGFTDEYHHSGEPIPLPLENFRTRCRYPLRTDFWERAAKYHQRWGT